MNKIWIIIFMLLPVNLMTSNTVKADAAMIEAKIYHRIVPDRRLKTSGIPKSYVWDFENKEYTALMAIDKQWYNRIRNQEKRRRYDLQHFPQMVDKGTKALQELVREFRRATRNWNPERKVNFVLGFVHGIPWTDDKTTGYDEFYKYPTETLVEGKGDCEDTSLLFASILSGLGFESALFYLPGHIAVGVKGNFTGWSLPFENDNYFFCETANENYTLGMMPEDFKNEDVTVMPITPNPVPSKLVRPQAVPPMPELWSPPSSQSALQNGRELYLDARYNEAIKSLQLALAGFSNPKDRAEVYIYLGGAEYGFSEGSASEAEASAKNRFQEALRQNPDQELPWPGHPKFMPWFEEVRRKSIGRLTVSASLPQTEIWIYGDEIKRKKLGSGTTPINIRLFKGAYIVEGIHEGRSKKENVKIRPNSHKQLELKIQPLPELPSLLELLSSPEVADVNQKIPIKAKVINDIGVKSIYLFYRFSHSLVSKPSEYNSIVLKDTLDIYSGYIPPYSEAGYVWYYLATDRAGNNPKSEIYKIRIKRDSLPEKPPILNEPIAHQGIWASYAWSSSVFEDGASLFDWNRGDSINFTYLREGKNHQTFGVQLDYSYQNLSNMSAIFQWGPALNPITLTLLGGVVGYRNFDSTRAQTTSSSRPLYMTPILGLGLKLYPLDRISIDAMCSFKLPSDFDITFLYHYEIGTRIYINNLLNMKFGYSQFELGDGNLKRMQIGLGFTF